MRKTFGLNHDMFHIAVFVAISRIMTETEQKNERCWHHFLRSLKQTRNDGRTLCFYVRASRRSVPKSWQRPNTTLIVNNNSKKRVQNKTKFYYVFYGWNVLCSDDSLFVKHLIFLRGHCQMARFMCMHQYCLIVRCADDPLCMSVARANGKNYNHFPYRLITFMLKEILVSSA